MWSKNERWKRLSIPYFCLQLRTHNDLNAHTTSIKVGEGLAPPAYSVKLKPCGEIAEEQLKNLEKRYQNVTIEDYVIMPDHIHVIIIIHKQPQNNHKTYTNSNKINHNK